MNLKAVPRAMWLILGMLLLIAVLVLIAIFNHLL